MYKKSDARAKLLFCLLNLLTFSLPSRRRILKFLLAFDQLKNKRRWDQILVLFNLLLYQLVVSPRPTEKSRLFPASELPFESSFASFIES